MTDGKPARSARGLARAMNAGSKRVAVRDLVTGEIVQVDALEREADDFYPTPVEPSRAFLWAEGSRLRAFPAIWEPAAGDGALARELETVGLPVILSDLVDRGCGATIRSFMDFDCLPVHGAAIVTNPPYKLTNWRDGNGIWQIHALRNLRAPYMALLLPWEAFGPAGMAAVWDRFPPARVYLMRWKIDFTGQGAPTSYHGWFVWDGETRLGETRMLMLDRKDGRQRELW